MSLLKKTPNSIYRHIVSVSGIVLIAKLLGFVKQIVTANAFGATIQTDLISISEGFINNVDYLIIQSFMTAFVPAYINIKEKRNNECNKFFSNTIFLMLISSICLSALFVVCAPFLSKLLAPSYTDDLSNKLAHYIIVLAPTLVIILQIATYNSLLKANEKFNQGEMISVFQSISLIVLVLALGNSIGPDVLILAFYVYAIGGVIYLFICSKRLWKIHLCNPFCDKDVRNLLVVIGPLILGFSAVFINQQVDKIIVSGFGEGSVTAMNYAAVLSNFICTFITSISGVLFTYISQKVVKEDHVSAAEMAIRSSIQMITILIPIGIITMFNAIDVIKIVFARGAFDSTAVENTSLSLCGYGLMFVPYAFREILNRFQYAYGDSKKPMINSTISIIVNILLSILLGLNFGILGVTLATSISVIINAVLNSITSYKINSNMHIRNYKKVAIFWIVGAISCILICVFGNIVFREFSPIIRIIFIAVLSGGIYFVINRRIIFTYFTRKR